MVGVHDHAAGAGGFLLIRRRLPKRWILFHCPSCGQNSGRVTHVVTICPPTPPLQARGQLVADARRARARGRADVALEGRRSCEDLLELAGHALLQLLLDGLGARHLGLGRREAGLVHGAGARLELELLLGEAPLQNRIELRRGHRSRAHVLRRRGLAAALLRELPREAALEDGVEPRRGILRGARRVPARGRDHLVQGIELGRGRARFLLLRALLCPARRQHGVHRRLRGGAAEQGHSGILARLHEAVLLRTLPGQPARELGVHGSALEAPHARAATRAMDAEGAGALRPGGST
mmetsp:Transcript_5200/g.12758  ORF Transcript_5200/g.12758 Transcript_5200/m.12758 type:complete len:295 (-) Transcript_5200:13-897(-)